MSAAAPAAALYRENLKKVTPFNEIDRAIADLAASKTKLRQTPIPRLVALAQECLEGMAGHAVEWTKAACEAKGIPYGTSLGSEEIQNGPLAVLRYLRLIMQALTDIEKYGVPQLPGEAVVGPDGRLRVQVVPTKGLFDSIAFSGFHAHVWQLPGVTKDNLKENMAEYFRKGRKEEGLACVLGAGNVSSIAALDAFGKIFQEGKVALLKMNPVNEYLGPIFEKAFQCLIREGFLRIIYGGAEVGTYVLQKPEVDEVHITGSVLSHDTIVWGPPGPERDRRKAANDPILKKKITSELGNVSPWIVVPGPYTDAQLRFQAENLASTILNNASFNCVATKAIVTWKGWPDRDKFLGMLQDVLNQAPPRKAYYPGAAERFQKFTGKAPPSSPQGTLPWTLIRDASPESLPVCFCEESFVCVCIETAVEARSEEDFTAKVADFVNERLFGTLGCSMMVHPKFRKRPGNEAIFQKLLADLKYGSIGVNYWSAMSYAMVSPPWGGYPGSDIHAAGSGIGFVHNTYMFDKPEKTVIEGPLTAFPKPLWFPTVKNANEVAWKVIGLYEKPSALKLPGLLISALKG